MTPWASDPWAVAGDETPTDHSAFERGVCPKFMRRVTYPKDFGFKEAVSLFQELGRMCQEGTRRCRKGIWLWVLGFRI